MTFLGKNTISYAFYRKFATFRVFRKSSRFFFEKPIYSGERKKSRFYKKGYCESLNRRMFLIFTQYIDMELLFQNM